MGRRSARRALLIALAPALLAAAADSPPIRSARWLAKGADTAAALTSEPAECLALPEDAAARASVEVGRAAFRSPLLLGGQAARAGLSCQACHINGHGSPDFVFPGLSGVPGTADVTSSLVSTSRGDSAFNPRPIPSLYDPPRLASRSPSSQALENFILGLVVGEFDGEEPPPAVLKGLADYVRSLPRSCESKAPVTIARHIEDIDRAAASAGHAAVAGDIAAARYMLLAVRDMLGRIAERYAAPALADEQAAVAALDREIAAILAEKQAAAVQERVLAWRGRLADRLRPVALAENRSLYNHDNLANWLRRR